jgi:hypothetical protein
MIRILKWNVDLGSEGFYSFPFIDLRQEREKWRPLVKIVVSVDVTYVQNAGIYWLFEEPLASEECLLHGVC